MSFSPYLILPFDSFFLLLGLNWNYSQVLPAVLLYSGIILVGAILFPKWFRRVTVIEYIMIFLILSYLLLLSIAPFFFTEGNNIGSNSFLRQFLALLGGISIYLSFRIFNVSNIVIARHIKIGLIMTVPIVLFQVFGNSGASFRVQGFSTEPSHFGHFLSFACIPWMIISGLSSKRNKMLFLYLNICLLLTFSITAYFSAFLVYFFWIINNLTLIKFHHVLFGLAFFTLSLFYIELDFTYVYQNVSFLLSYNNFIEGLQFSASLSDRFYSFWAPITGLLDSKIIFGRGIGGDYLILPEIVPREVYELISSVRSGEVGVSSFFGKIITWGGWPLMLAYIFIFFMLYQKADKKIRYFAFPVFINSLFSMGALVVPYIWMWLAILKNKNYD